ncbi:hypothetical protein ECE50_008450 [Chitinophaga sp. Mgbs1]|uniref:Uncharacterized protein n=1 Tax=Chitinophaga solisilvae TaxID=1233460 RepID=A0A3S1D044_9BACT|nr:hypothetical protein [Chitinophaga solisilvae]
MFLSVTRYCLHQISLPLIALLMLASAATAQVDTIDQQHVKLNTAYLRPGIRQYLVYFQIPRQPQLLYLSLWVRQIEKTTLHNQPAFRISQQWYSQDSTRYASFTSYNSVKDFSPLYHAAVRGKELTAYNWSATSLTGDTTAGNKAAGFRLDFSQPNYNWHLDIETFEMLPLAAGKTFVIRFYDAGLEPPKYVTYKVTGSEVLQTLDNKNVDCWKLFIEGESPQAGHYEQTFWISKSNHELLKEEDSYGGMFRYKIKLPGFTQELGKRFKTE